MLGFFIATSVNTLHRPTQLSKPLDASIPEVNASEPFLYFAKALSISSGSLAFLISEIKLLASSTFFSVNILFLKILDIHDGLNSPLQFNEPRELIYFSNSMIQLCLILVVVIGFVVLSRSKALSFFVASGRVAAAVLTFDETSKGFAVGLEVGEKLESEVRPCPYGKLV